MRQIVIYKSKTGFTKRYAKWLCEALKCDCLSFEDAQSADLETYDIIIFGSSFRAGQVEGLKWYRDTVLPLGKTNVAFVTGAMPPQAPEVAKATEQNFTSEERKKIRIFYLRGGLNYEEMGLGDRLMMKVFRSMLKNRRLRTEEDRELAEQVQKSFDCTDRANLEPMLNYLQGL